MNIESFNEKFRFIEFSQNPYTGYQCEGPFNMLPQCVEGILQYNSHTEGEKLQYLGADYWKINTRKNGSRYSISIKEQLWINRLFAPFMPMAHVVPIKTKKGTHYLSICVNNPESKKFQDFNNLESAKMARAIYEFLTDDNDRNSVLGINISKSGTIFDFDSAGYYKSIRLVDDPYLAGIGEWSSEKKKEFVEMIIFWKKYITLNVESKSPKRSKRKGVNWQLEWIDRISSNSNRMSALRLLYFVNTHKHITRLDSVVAEEIDNMIELYFQENSPN